MRSTIFSSLSNKFLTAMVIIAMMIMAIPVRPAFAAATIIVTTTADEYDSPGNGFCSLREAIANANNDTITRPDCPAGSGADTIVLTSGSTYTLSNAAGGGDLDINDAAGLTIQANETTAAIIDGSGQTDHVLDTTAGSGNLTLNYITITRGNASTGAGINFSSSTGTLTLTNSTVFNNTSTSASSCGAGIYNNTAANINITNSTIIDNHCDTAGADGGGLFKGSGGTLTITNSTFNNNTAADNGGGIQINMASGTATITNSTFASNSAGTLGGGIQVSAGTVTVKFSTFSGNAANSGVVNTGGAIQANGGSVTATRSILANSIVGLDCDQSNLGTVDVAGSLVETKGDCTGALISSSDPGLGALTNNGGPTQTMAITNTSPAYNTASSCISITEDQRGITRPQGPACDLGAYELDNIPPAVVSVVRADPDNTNALSVDFTVTFSEPVDGVDTSDFTLFTTGSISGASVSGVTGSGSTRTVTVNTGSGSGTLRLDVVDDDSIVDSVSNPLGGAGAGNGNFSSGQSYTIDKNLAPTDINLSSTSVAENLPAGTTVGTFTTTDPDAGDTFSYALVAGTGSTDNAAFTISGDQLKTAFPFNALTKNSYSIRVQTTDSGSLTFEKVFTISVTDQAAIFSDVPDSYWAASWIERLYNAGITGGCSASPLMYCPESTVTRAQIAVFLERGMNGSSYTPPPATGTVFTDVPASYWAAAWIEQLAADGITGGCSTGIYCPDNTVTRAQMAVFLLRAKHGSAYTPPAAIGVFGDVPASYWAAAWIEQLAAEGITGGCGSGNYCPESPVTRAQMAVFLVRTFNLP